MDEAADAVPDLVALYGLPLLIGLAVAALLIGFSKTSFGGLGAISVAVFALAMPAKESTAAVLLLLITGDLVAIARYRGVRWRMLGQLLPSVLPGLALGALFMLFVDDVVMRRSIGVLLLAMVLLQLWQRWRARGATTAEGATAPPPTTPNWFVATAAGTAAGFTTMTANAAGPVMAVYFLAARIDKAQFIGTNAWFFCIVNISKVPIAASLGLYTAEGLWLVAVLVPAVLVGTFIGARIIHLVSQRQFEIVTLVASAGASLSLLVR